MKVALFLHCVVVAFVAAARWIFAPRREAALGLLVFLLTIAGSAAKPGPWWGY